MQLKQPQQVVIILDRGKFGRWSRDLAINQFSLPSLACLPCLPFHQPLPNPANRRRQTGRRTPNANVPSKYLCGQLAGAGYVDVLISRSSRDAKEWTGCPSFSCALSVLERRRHLSWLNKDFWAASQFVLLSWDRFRIYRSHLNTKHRISPISHPGANCVFTLMLNTVGSARGLLFISKGINFYKQLQPFDVFTTTSHTRPSLLSWRWQACFSLLPLARCL